MKGSMLNLLLVWIVILANVFKKTISKSILDSSIWEYEERIIEGELSMQFEFPFMVAVEFHRGHFPFCGGVLISPSHVLTAHHCLATKVPMSIQAVLNMIDFENPENETRIYRIASIIRYPFDAKTFEGDVALLALNEPADTSIQPVALPDDSSNFTKFVGRRCYVIGWGKVGEKQPQSPLLKKAEVTIFNQSLCIKAYPDVLESMFCAGNVGGGADACDGDSGGPLVCKENGSWVLLGIVSFGEGCGKPEYPGVYSKVLSFMPWIKEKMAEQITNIIYL